MNKRTIFSTLFIPLLYISAVSAQNVILSGYIKDGQSKEALIGASVSTPQLKSGMVTDENGFFSYPVKANDSIDVVISYIGYKTQTKKLFLTENTTLNVFLTSDAELEVVTIASTRTNSRIEDIATKVEVLGTDDMIEESSVKPASIASILGDLSVIHIQQTSAISGAASVRMQGLDGKYTQILRDGLPLYEGFSGSFGVLQIPPLDLKQVEIIKGSNSTLYSGGAIGGLINLVSKEPTVETDASITLNQSSLKESNVNGYFAKRKGKIGVTTFVGTTFQKAVDVNKDGFSDVPAVNAVVIHPRLFFYFNPKTTLNIGLSGTYENRNGGDMIALNSSPSSSHPFFEKNKSTRQNIDYHLVTESKNHHLTLKGVFSQFDRLANQSGFMFQGVQKSFYTEGSDYIKIKNHDLVYGVNYIVDAFDKTSKDSSKITSFDNRTLGLFVQDGWQIVPKWFVEIGMRADFLNRNMESTTLKKENFILPRLAFLYKPTHDFTARLALGTGYKVPNVFTAESVSESFKDIPPLSKNVLAERSNSLNGDINYHILLGKVGVWLNQAFYYTVISKPVVLQNNSLQNANYTIRSIGSDSYIRMSYDHIEFYLGYNHTLSDVNRQPVLLAPRDKLALTAAYEIEGKWRMGIEASWVGNQYLTETQQAPNYWFWAGMVERKFGHHVSLVLNCENLFDARQSRRESLFTGDIRNPNFKSIYMPIDGRVVNLALRLKL